MLSQTGRFHSLLYCWVILFGLPRWHSGKESDRHCRRRKRCGFDPWVKKVLWRRKWQTTPVSLLRKFHGQRRPVGSIPWGCKELDMTEQLSTLKILYQSSTSAYLGYLHSSPIVNNAAVSIEVRNLCELVFLFISGKYPEVELLISWQFCFFFFSEALPYSFPQQLY